MEAEEIKSLLTSRFCKLVEANDPAVLACNCPSSGSNKGGSDSESNQMSSEEKQLSPKKKLKLNGDIYYFFKKSQDELNEEESGENKTR